jgi:hypothetical protein
MVKRSSAGPRLKICKSCEEPNPPRQFFCKSCNTPFYSEDVLANRSRPSTPSNISLEEDDLESPIDVVAVVLPEPKAVDKALTSWKSRVISVVCEKADNSGSDPVNLTLLSDSKESSVQDILLDIGDGHRCDENNLFYNLGGTVNSISFLNDRVFAVLVNHSRIVIGETNGHLLGHLDYTCHDPEIKSIQWVPHLFSDSILGVITVVGLDGVEMHLIPKSMPSGSRIDWNSSLIWRTDGISFFPSAIDVRTDSSSQFIELLITNNLNNFTHYIRISIPDISTCLCRIYAYNDPVRRVSDDVSADVSSGATGTCVAFHKLNPYFFLTGFSNGTIGLFDIRNDQGPINVISTLAGIRRWLIDLVPSCIDPTIVFSAFQAGAFVNLDIADVQVQPIGGDVRSAQCWGIDAIGERVFCAMSSGVVITLDRTLRDKIRRGMTGYISAWGEISNMEQGKVSPGILSLDDKILEAATKKREGKYVCRLFAPKKFPKNIKHLKASDGASNEPNLSVLFHQQEPVTPVPIKCIRASDNGTIAYGLDNGVVHIFQYRE